MIIVCLLWALGTVIGKNLLGNTPETFRPSTFNELRFFIATPLLFLLVRLSGCPLGIRREHLPGMLFVSFCGMFLFMVLFIFGLSQTTAANTGIILGAIPLIIVLISVARGVDRLTVRLAAGVVLGLCGVLLMNWQNGAPAFTRGDVLILIAGFCWGIYAVWGEKYLEIYPPLLATAWIFLLLSLFYIPLFLYEFPRMSWSAIPLENWAYLVFSAVGPLLAANTLYYAAIKYIGPSRSGIYINLEPVFTVILAALFLGERITPFQVAGLGVIILGVSLARLPEQERKESGDRGQETA
jgi:drug/metabolite transporter (DMT)-like permease